MAEKWFWGSSRKTSSGCSLVKETRFVPGQAGPDWGEAGGFGDSQGESGSLRGRPVAQW